MGLKDHHGMKLYHTYKNAQNKTYAVNESLKTVAPACAQVYAQVITAPTEILLTRITKTFHIINEATKEFT